MSLSAMRVVGDRIALFRKVALRLMPATSLWRAKVTLGNACHVRQNRTLSESRSSADADNLPLARESHPRPCVSWASESHSFGKVFVG
jgi:hypothetical protein